MAPKNLPVRPTTDFAKTGLFNILHNYFDFEQLDVLDLFCGTGSISFEFASRGTSRITCVDEHAGCLKFIRDFAGRLNVSGIRTVLKSAFAYVKSCDEQFDIIFADPPFEQTTTDQLPDEVLTRKLLKPAGWLIVEHQSGRVLQSQAQPVQVRRYGNCTFSIYQAAPA